MTIQGVFFDFGFVIGFPRGGLDRRYLYLDWDGIESILRDPALAQGLRPGVGRAELERFFTQEIYAVFVQHEQTDGIDPQSNRLFLEKLPRVFAVPVDQALVDRLLAHLDTMKYITIDPAAAGVLGALRRKGLRLGLVSNMLLPGKLLRARLAAAGILDCFDAVAVSSDVGYIKPHPGIFRAALTGCGLRADEVVFVGDTYQQDILGARRVGMKTVWLNSRSEPRALAQDAPPDFEIGALAALVDLPMVHR